MIKIQNLNSSELQRQLALATRAVSTLLVNAPDWAQQRAEEYLREVEAELASREQRRH